MKHCLRIVFVICCGLAAALTIGRLLAAEETEAVKKARERVHNECSEGLDYAKYHEKQCQVDLAQAREMSKKCQYFEKKMEVELNIAQESVQYHQVQCDTARKELEQALKEAGGGLPGSKPPGDGSSSKSGTSLAPFK